MKLLDFIRLALSWYIIHPLAHWLHWNEGRVSRDDQGRIGFRCDGCGKFQK